MSDYSRFNLRANPFEDITPVWEQEDRGQIIWAGMPALKQKLEDIHRQILTNTSHQIVMNWGSVGSGKTHAAYYFGNLENLRAIVPELDEEIFYIRVNIPQEGNSAVQQLCHDVVDFLTLSRTRKHINTLITEVGREEFLKILSQRIGSEEFAKAVLLLGENDNSPQSSFLSNPEFTEMMSRYLYGSATSMELKKMGLARPLKTTSDFVKILVGILQCLIGLPGTKKGRVLLWIDEMEDLLWFTPKQYRPFAQFLRNVFDKMSHRMTIFMNFTLAEPNMDTIKMLLGEALWSRVTNKVRFNELSVSEGILYCKELLEPYHIERKGEYSPFTEDALTALFETISPAYMTPRKINDQCGALLNSVIDLENVSEISKDIVSEWIAQQEKRLEGGDDI